MLTRPGTGKTHDQAARDLIPMIAEAASGIEATGRLPLPLLDALHEARLFHMLSPRSIGGEEVDPITFFNAIEAIASADASTAWCVGQACGVAMASAYLDPAISREIFGGPRSVVASGPNTRGAKAVKTAVRRHQLKRWVRELFRIRLKAVLAGYDCVVLFRCDPPEDAHVRLDDEIVGLVTRALAATATPGLRGGRR
jgi:hypothetical protein